MKHHKNKRTLGRPKDQRNALLRSLAVSLIAKEKIVTTEAKAKELRPYIEKLVTKARSNSLATIRLLDSRLSNERAVSKLLNTIAKRYESRAGGYTRIIKLPARLNDGAKMAHIEFV